MDLSDSILVPASLGIVHVCEKAGLPTQFSPLVALVAAVLIGFLQNPALAVWNVTVLNGLLAGMAAYGFYSGAAAVGNRIRPNIPTPRPLPTPPAPPGAA